MTAPSTSSTTPRRPAKAKTSPVPAVEYVFVPRARCPGCESADFLTYRSAANGDGSTTRHTQCRYCGHKFRVVME
jgi:DNA-directed RNA polymerase subunit M/transcription elongation factor TFIIS